MSFIFPSMQQETITPNCLESVSTAVETDSTAFYMSDTSDYVPTSPTYGPNTPTCSEMNVCYCCLSDAGHAPRARSPTCPSYTPGNPEDDTGITFIQDLDGTIHCLNFFNRLTTSDLESLASKITKLLEMSEQGKTI